MNYCIEYLLIISILDSNSFQYYKQMQKRKCLFLLPLCILFYSLFNVEQVTSIPHSGGPNSFIRGLANDSALTFDPTFSDDLRNFLDRPNFVGSYFISYSFSILQYLKIPAVTPYALLKYHTILNNKKRFFN